MNAPCNNCPDRHAGCHGSCEKYAAFKEEKAKVNEERRAERTLYADYRNYKVEKYKRLGGKNE